MVFHNVVSLITVLFSECLETKLSYCAAVYDVTRRETFTNLSDIWAKEIDLYATNQDCIKMLVGNKVDKVCIYENSSIIFQRISLDF